MWARRNRTSNCRSGAPPLNWRLPPGWSFFFRPSCPKVFYLEQFLLPVRVVSGNVLLEIRSSAVGFVRWRERFIGTDFRGVSIVSTLRSLSRYLHRQAAVRNSGRGAPWLQSLTRRWGWETCLRFESLWARWLKRLHGCQFACWARDDQARDDQKRAREWGSFLAVSHIDCYLICWRLIFHFCWFLNVFCLDIWYI